MLVELIESGVEAQRRKQQEFFDLADRLRRSTDPEEVTRLGDEMGRMVFGNCEIKLARQASALLAAKGAWRSEDHPELVEGAAPCVRSLRQQSLQRFEKIERHRPSQ